MLEYLAQSNNNANCVDPDKRFKFIDDLSILEVVNLLTIGISSYNIKNHVPSDMPLSNLVLPSKNLKLHENLQTISDWTDKQKMKLNLKKSNAMIFNFSRQNQFTTRLQLKGENLSVIKGTTLLGTKITDDLCWDENTKNIVKKANMRLQLLREAAEYTSNYSDLKLIYFSYIRSVLDQSCAIWHNSLTQTNIDDIERVQKNALRVIMKEKYESYQNALDELGINDLVSRRIFLSTKFADNCLKNEKTKHLFQLNNKNHKMTTRNPNKYIEIPAKTERFKKSTVPFLVKLLNENNRKHN